VSLAAGAGYLIPPAVALWAAIAAAGYSLVWHASGARRFPGSHPGWQVNRQIATKTRLGRVYFGGSLGFGIVTQMSSPLVYVVALYATAVHLPLALLAGVGFGLGRSRPIATALRARGRMTPLTVMMRFTSSTEADRILGCGVASAIIATAMIHAI
jgi:hypothetical protein